MAAAMRNKFVAALLNVSKSLLLRQPLYRNRLYYHTSQILNAVGQEIKMPSLSPTMAEGTIVKWLKKEGDPVEPGDVLCEIQTDKAVMAFEVEEEGILAKILVKQDVKDVKVGTVIALMVGEGEDWKGVEVPTDSSTKDIKIGAQPLLSGTVPGLNILMPSLSPTMTEGTILKWHKKEGEKVSPGDVLCDIQTDKAVMSFETEEEGILAKILVSEGTAGVSVGTLVALMVAEGENWKDVIIPSSKTDQISDDPVLLSTPTSPLTSSHVDHENYGPAVRGLLELYQIDKSKITPTGRNKKLLKADVLSYVAFNKLERKPPKPVPLPGSKNVEETGTTFVRPSASAKYVDIEISSMRRTIAKRLTESKMSIPHAYATVESDLDQVLLFRKQLKLAGIAVSVNDFVVKAVALALRNCPRVNCLYANGETVLVPDVDVSVAVATDSGLITPIIKCADGKTVDDISAEMKELAGRARQGKLQLHEFQGGSFTISNLGMFAISEFSAIINPPQCGILAVGSGRSTIDVHGKTVTRMTCMLSYDARAISESAAADFLETIQSLLENPATIIMGSAPSRRAQSIL